ncbi:hypothetical protein BLNAU_18910 [Blattamonas nauphoetae]|uniref:Uncharacterized protein n=1 Tax=Blattamonas nauphoetae TaxID=2049346 RepID=A0ABQ9X6C9_9EUKA|nr:hypothetical protein BLNAU_18910 [Blattamonas nauphoetae]
MAHRLEDLNRAEMLIYPFFALSLIRLMNLLGLIFVHRLYVEATFPEERILPLSLQLAFAPSTEAPNKSGNEQAIVPPIKLNHGTYHSEAYIMDSISLSLHGSGTTICHTSSFGKTEKVNDQDSTNHENRNENTTPFIFVFSNSTISMSHISLDCGWRGTSVGRISSSRLTIENCPIISNPESSPFVMNNGWDDFGSSIFFVDCCHQSIEKSSLLPLVSLTPSHITHASHTSNEQKVTSTFVSCSGLSLSDAHLVFGSGPLVGFSSSTEPNAGFSNKLETVLIGSRLVNMTSCEGSGAMNGWSGRQQILGSSVTRSTNHLYGTTCIDMNLGGSLLCSNTSFSHCHSSLEAEFVENKTYTLQHKTGATGLKFGSYASNNITVTRCTFLDMNATGSTGGAIDHFISPGSLTVTESSFSQCRSSSQGGSISFYCKDSARAPFSVSSSLFVDGSAGTGGAIQCSAPTSLPLRWIVCCLENAVLRKVETPTPNITNCDSTSDMPNVCFYNLNYDDYGTLIPAVPSTSTASLVEIRSSLAADQTSSTIQMRVSNNLDGKMLVVVDNTNNHEPPSDDFPPAIARLLTFDFSSSTDSAPQTVSFGEWEEQQYESDYCVIGASIANTRLSFSSSIALTTPNPPRIVQIVCSLGSGTDHCWLQLKGRTLQNGTYTVKLMNPELSFSVEFDGSKVENTSTLISSSHSEACFGTGSKLSFMRKYEVESVTFEGSSDPFFLDPPRLVFTTPASQPRLISVHMVGFKNNTTKDTVLITFFSFNLPNGEYVLTLLSPTSESVSFTTTVTDGNETPMEAIVFSKDSSDIKLKFGLIYTVKELTSGPTIFLIDKALSIEVPAEPKRIEEGRVTLNGPKDEATFRLKGRVLTDGRYTLTLKSVSSELISEAILSDDGELLFKVPISTASSSILGFGETYNAPDRKEQC